MVRINGFHKALIQRSRSSMGNMSVSQSSWHHVRAIANVPMSADPAHVCGIQGPAAASRLMQQPSVAPVCRSLPDARACEACGLQSAQVRASATGLKFLASFTRFRPAFFASYKAMSARQ